jgi:hypothetical protein
MCGYSSVSVLAEKKSKEIYHEKRCVAKDMVCELHESILVWDQSVFHDCPYEKIPLEGIFLWDKNVLKNVVSDIVLQPTRRISICSNVTAFETNEGLYVSWNLGPIIKVSIAKGVQDITNKLILANVDYQQDTMLGYFKALDMQMCAVMSNMLNIASRLDDEFFEVSNNKGKNAILYIRNGMIFVPECVEVDSIQIIEDSNECFKSIMIKFHAKQVEKIGYIDSANIIRDVAKEVSCKENSEVVVAGGKWFQRVKNTIVVRDKNEFKWTSISTMKSDIRKINTHHPSPVLASTSAIADFYEIQKREHIGMSYYVEPMKDDLAQGTIDKNIKIFIDKIKHPFRWIWNYIIIVSIIILAIIVFLTIGCGCVKTNCCGMARKIKRALRGQLSYEPLQNQVMELKDLIARSGKPKEEEQQQENKTSRLRKLI